MHQAFREFCYLLIEKVTTSKLRSTCKGQVFLQGKSKSAGILCGLRAFLMQPCGNKCLLQALLPYGVLPNGWCFSTFFNWLPYDVCREIAFLFPLQDIFA